jgi:outer membrane lipoprotein-sorting protein
VKRFLPVLLVVVVLLGGCVSTKKLIRRERTMALNDVLLEVGARNSKVHSLKGDGSITVESPEGSNTGSFDAYLKKPDSLRVELNGPFGIHIGTLTLSREQFLFYNRMENTAIVGKPDGTTLRSMFRLKMKFDEVIHAFTGEFPSAAADDSLERFYVYDDQYVIKYHTQDGSKEYHIDGDTFIITSYRVYDNSGNISLAADATRIESGDDMPIAMPMLLRVIFPQEHRSVTIAYDGVQLNEPVGCSFTLPRKAEVIYR